MYSLNKQNSVHKIPEEEYDLNDIVGSLGRYKVSIAIITTLALFLALIYAYFATNIYRSNMSIQIQPEPQSGITDSDMLAEALSGQKVNITNEALIFKSKSVIRRALEIVPMEIRYYTKEGMSSTELYKNSPFTVDYKSMPESLMKYKFKLHPVDNLHFRLTIEPSLVMKIMGYFNGEKLINFSEIYTYGTPINNQLFNMTINKNSNLENAEYFFTIVPNEQMIESVQTSLIAAPASDTGSLLALTYEDNSPERSKDMLSAIAHAYQEQNINKTSASAQKTLSFIDKQLEGINQNLQTSASNLKDYKISHTVTVDLRDKALAVTGKVSELEKERDDLDIQEGVFKNLQTNIKDGNINTEIDPGSAAIVGSPILILIQKLQEAITLRATLIVDYTDKHPSVVKVNQQINSLRNSLKGSVESNLRSIQQRKATLDNIIQKNNSVLTAIPEEEKQLSKLMNGYEVNQKIYEYLLQKRAETTILESSTVSGDWIVDHASTEKLPVKPYRGLIVFLGLLLGLITGIIQALVRNAMAATIQSVSDVEKRTALPILAVLPYFKNKKSLYQDALRVLLTKFEYSPDQDKPKMITLTSSVLGEGRATTAIEFGRVMAQSGKKVIIIDMDMRQPSVHKKLNFENTSGISTFLNGKDELIRVINHTDQSNLDIISAGPTATSPYDLIMSEQFKELIKNLKETYDYILLVAPPAGLVADALVLMRLSDLNLVVFRAQYSKKYFVESIDRFVKEHQFENIGIILNSLELNKIRYWRIK
jgi:capsular exopolysaccharide synthesis family protein